MTRFYEEIEHTADWAIRVWGDTAGQLFEHAAAAMFQLQGADLDAAPEFTAPVECSAPDIAALLVAWLSELLYQSEISDVAFTRFAAEIIGDAAAGFSLSALANGYPGRGPLAHVKAVTYYNLSVEEKDGGWEATVTFDT